MADRDGHTATLWALVVGVNYYPKRPNENLEGCVWDARCTHLYLQEAVKTPLDTVVLTASEPPGSGTLPPEDPEFWPTYTNVKRHLSRIIKTARSGDRVYIHFSGHGTRTTTDIALVLLHDDGLDSRCLRSQMLAEALRRMVEIGLLVTLVLDCCFSGGTFRGPNLFNVGVRSIKYDASLEPPIDDESNMVISETSTGLRDANLQQEWLINPQGYTILAACGPEEKAFEILANGHRQGALTHFLLKALHSLRLRGIALTHSSLYENISTNFHALWPHQTPMRFGNADRTIFGGLQHPSDSVPIYRDSEGRLRLRAGALHGVHELDEYLACPFDTSEDRHDIALGKANTQVVSVWATESVLAITDLVSAHEVSTGWKARQITSLSPPVMTVRLPTAHDQRGFSTTGLRYVNIITEDTTQMQGPLSSCICTVELGKDNYQILDASLNDMFPFLTIPADPCTQECPLANVLQHMAKFKYFEAIENRTPSPAFEASFSITSVQSSSNSNRIHVQDDGKWSIRIRNNGATPLYIGIFNFRPSWEVKCLTSASNGAEFLVIPPATPDQASERLLSIQMRVPQFLRNVGISECEEVMKFFVTQKQTQIRMALPEMLETVRGVYGGLRGSDDLSQFLSSLASTYRGQKEESWATRSFMIRTTAI